MATLLVLGSTVLLLVTWVGYPLTMALLSRLKGREVEPAEQRPGPVTAVVCTRGPADLVRDRVENLLACEWPEGRPDVVVALDASTPAEVERETRVLCPQARVVRAEGPAGKPGAVNVGVAQSTCDVVVMCDTAQRFERDTLMVLARAMSNPAFGAVSGRLELAAGSTKTLVGQYWRMERRLREDEARVHSAVGVTGAVYALRRTAFRPLPAGVILDDVFTPMDLVLRGYRVGFAASAVARETRTPDVAQEGRRKERTLTGVLQLVALMPEVLRPWKNAIFTQFVCHKLLRLGTPPLILALAAGSLVETWRLAQGWPPAMQRIAGGAAGVATVVVLALPRLRALLHEFVAIQVAVVRALWRAARGQWEVW